MRQNGKGLVFTHKHLLNIRADPVYRTGLCVVFTHIADSQEFSDNDSEAGVKWFSSEQVNLRVQSSGAVFSTSGCVP